MGTFVGDRVYLLETAASENGVVHNPGMPLFVVSTPPSGYLWLALTPHGRPIYKVLPQDVTPKKPRITVYDHLEEEEE